MKFSLADKSAIVTGGVSGIGRAICEVFSEMGATVHILDVAGDAIGWISASSADTKIFYHRVDITKIEEVESVMNSIDQASGIDILVNNAGIAHIGNAEDTSPLDFERVMQVNVHGAYHCIHAALPYMKKRKKGCILNIASTVASIAIANRSHEYCPFRCRIFSENCTSLFLSK